MRREKNAQATRALNAFDRDGVSCDFCHRALDPEYVPGVSPPEDEDVLAGLLEVPTTHSAGQYVIDPHIRSRGPSTTRCHPTRSSPQPFHRLWLHVEAVDGTGETVYESGVYDADTGVLHIDADITIYEAKMGLSPCAGR